MTFSPPDSGKNQPGTKFTSKYHKVKTKHHLNITSRYYINKVIRLIFSALALVALLCGPVHAATEEAAQDTSSSPSHEQPKDEESGTSTSAPDTVVTEPAEEPGQGSGEKEGEDSSEGQDGEERGNPRLHIFRSGEAEGGRDIFHLNRKIN